MAKMVIYEQKIQVLDQLLCPMKGWRFEPNVWTKVDVLCNVTNV